MKRHEKKTRRLIPIQDILKVLLAAKGHDRVLIGAYWHTRSAIELLEEQNLKNLSPN
jgi:hypothetical protein